MRRNDMEWITVSKKEFVAEQVINTHTGKIRVAFSPVEFTEDKKKMVKYLCKDFGFNHSTHGFKEALLGLQEEYDKSDDVNCFFYNGEKAWLDKATRVGLVNSCDVIEASGGDEYTVYFNGTPVTLKITVIRQILNAVEMYAIQCYAVTEQHKAEIAALTKRKDILEYDITKGYPPKLEFGTENE